MGIEQTFLV